MKHLESLTLCQTLYIGTFSMVRTQQPFRRQKLGCCLSQFMFKEHPLTFDFDGFSSDLDSGTVCDTISKSDSAKNPTFQMKLGSQNEVRESVEDKHPIKSVTEKLEKTLTPDRFSDQEKCKFFFLPNPFMGQMKVIADFWIWLL